MKVSFFIDRPVFSAVISILIVIVGIIGLTMLPIDQYPQITPPVVKISASYPGASALTVSQAVATPIEQELNGTPGMLYMESTSSNSGGFSATVTFDIDTDADLAAVKRVIAGTQAMTVYKPLKLIASEAAKLAIALVKGEKVAFKSEKAEGGVEQILLDPIVITKDNVDFLVKDGFYTKEQLGL